MKTLAIIIMLIGMIAGLGELAFTKYFAGEKRAEGVLYDRSGSSTPVAIKVAQEDLPVRVNMLIYGSLELHASRPIGQIEIRNNLPGEGNQFQFFVGVDEDDEGNDVAVGRGGLQFRAGDIRVNSQKSLLFDNATAGNWSFSMKPLREEEYKFNRVTGTVFVKSKAVNWYIAGPGLVMMLGGFIAWIAIYKHENPEA